MQARASFPAGMFFVLIFASLVHPAMAAADTPLARSPAAPGALDDPQLDQAYQYWKAGQLDRMIALVEPMARQGSAAAQFLMGEFCSNGIGLPEDDEQAVQWWRKSAEQGVSRAQNELGVALTDGRGTDADPQQAVDWYRKAVAQGSDVAEVNLGLMYLNGLGGLQQDDKQAVAWFRKAAEQGLGWAQYYLGMAYVQGRGVGRNMRRAVEWVRKAAEQEYTEAEYFLGGMYKLGQGVPQDYGLATYWTALAARQGYELAEQVLPTMLQRLRRMQLSAATAVRAKPDATAAIIPTPDGREYAYELAHSGGWVEVYIEDHFTVGYISADQWHGRWHGK